MKNRSLYARLLALALCLVMMFSLAACTQQSATNTPSDSSTTSDETKTPDTSNDTPAASDTPKTDEVVTLTGFIGTSNGSIDQAPWYEKFLLENFGIQFDFQESNGLGGDQVIQALMAGGELPDIIGFTSTNLFADAVNAGMLLNLDDYKDQLPNIYNNDVYSAGLAYKRANYSKNGDGGMYGLPAIVGNYDGLNYDAQMRYELYEAVGSPKMESWDDLLDTLKAMQELEPVTADGLNTYGLTLWTDWDGVNMSACNMFVGQMEGIDIGSLGGFVEINADATGDVTSIFDADSCYYRALQFLYKANQMGLIDPDSATQTSDSAFAKMANGQALYVPWKWASSGYNTNEHVNADNYTGYASVWCEHFRVAVPSDRPIGVGNYALAISADCKNIDKALEFINWFYSFEGQDLLQNGPEGFIWDYDENGKKILKMDILNENANPELPDGGTLADAQNVFNWSGMCEYTLIPETQQPISLKLGEEYALATSNKMLDSWRAANDGAGDMYYKQVNSDTPLLSKYSAAFNLVTAMPDDLVTLQSQIGDIVKTNSWKMVYAKDEAEFESIWAQTKADAEAMGVDQLVDWAKEAIARALVELENYTG